MWNRLNTANEGGHFKIERPPAWILLSNPASYTGWSHAGSVSRQSFELA